MPEAPTLRERRVVLAYALGSCSTSKQMPEAGICFDVLAHSSAFSALENMRCSGIYNLPCHSRCNWHMVLVAVAHSSEVPYAHTD